MTSSRDELQALDSAPMFFLQRAFVRSYSVRIKQNLPNLIENAFIEIELIELFTESKVFYTNCKKLNMTLVVVPMIFIILILFTEAIVIVEMSRGSYQQGLVSNSLRPASYMYCVISLLKNH